MGRWVELSRARVRRDWMLPGPGDDSLDSDRVTQYAKEPVQTAERRHRTPWARGRRGPLRRNEGIPSPLETPGFVRRPEPRPEEDPGRRLSLPLLLFVASAIVTAVLTGLFSGR